MSRSLAATLIVAIGVVSSVHAHDLWLIPNNKIAVGKPALVRAHVGMDFPKSESAPDTAKFSKRIVIRPDGGQDELKAAGKDDKSGLLEFTPTKPGVYVLAVETQPKLITLEAEKFNEYLVTDGMPHIYRLRAKIKTLDKPGSERYSKYVKSLVKVGSENTGDYLRAIGMLLEIVPQRDPFALKVGDTLPVVVHFKGNPLPEANVGWQHPGDGATARGYVRTNGKGEALIPVAQTGLMTLRLTHMTRPQAGEYEWESFWTTLTFRIE